MCHTLYECVHEAAVGGLNDGRRISWFVSLDSKDRQPELRHVIYTT